jgi:M6 family metalloprotease-like protein
MRIGALLALVLISGCAGPAPATLSPTVSPAAVESSSPSASEGVAAGIQELKPMKVLPYSVVIPAAAGVDPLTTVSVPQNITPAPAGSNVKLWITDPGQLGKGLGGSGLFYWLAGGEAVHVPANPDGTLYASWAPGRYTIDIVEPRGRTKFYQRRLFKVRVTSSGSTVDGVKANKEGVSVVAPRLAMQVSDTIAKEIAELIALANLPVSNFTPTSPCQLLDQITPARGLAVALSAGFPKAAMGLPSFGRIRALILPVSFNDLTSNKVTSELFKSTANRTRDFFFAQSYGKLAIDFFVTPNWVQLPFSVKKYKPDGVVYSADELISDLLALTSDQITYGDYDAVFMLPPETVTRTQMGTTAAHLGLWPTRSGPVTSVATGAWDWYSDGVIGGDWKSMAHETGHMLGLYDEDYQHKSTTLGEWGIMSAAGSNYAIELGAWDRYLQGWLTNDQIACRQLSDLSKSGESITLDPVVGQSAGLKSIMIPISASKILVIESRKRKSLDRPFRSGVLVYTVDMKLGQLGGGYVIKPRPGATDKKECRDAALLAGDSITVGGVTISVVRIGENSDVVKISN